jgi:hypothetical protein
MMEEDTEMHKWTFEELDAEWNFEHFGHKGFERIT